ncbi:fumarylacetoacetate hydrolase family protein [Thalassovita taeanensis]|uniref:2-keto-4-pentenoate hydratase/2-oxohepta-3-ene-1,7-dioic acid hydratase (Catechol pathway) n=1 Tax=Thalassovita taeanensis TaxID=657014 RepID=A0A1H9HCJ5_9RHOB|nr:fumarylacetoacetate hydrolase family protein [Thalassovita taeanensis]SEQ60080.1 2-keto-4-pentenoate hydratase/2-oxohepta-3-ene-1,7-dioic acid hydratase (catechol pathway) [Thalassovita taeanensis]
MKLVTYIDDSGRARAGALIAQGQSIVDLAGLDTTVNGAADGAFSSVLTMIEGGQPVLDRAYRLLETTHDDYLVARDGTVLLAPVQPVPQMRDCLCFEKHLVQAFAAARQVRASTADDPAAALAEMERTGELRVPATFYEQPIYYKANRFAVTGTDHDVTWPRYSQLMDFELEFGVYINSTCVDVPKARARDVIYGYTILNDFSARDAQTAEMGGQLGPAKGKDFDRANPMGPCLVTADEMPDPYDLTMIARVNGEEWGRGNSGTMHWSFEDVIAHISRSETLYPGEFLGSGTVGNGCGLEHMRFLKHGDTVELEVEGIGVLRNRVLAPHLVG